MTTKDWGIVVFAVVLCVNVSGLTIDGVLLKLRVPTITELSDNYPVIAIAIIAINVIGLAALVVHFWGSK